MRLYRVKLGAAALHLHRAYIEVGNLTKDGYLAVNGKIQSYSIGDAKKKAYNWDGKIEHYKNPLLEAITKVEMTQIGENALSHGVICALRGREAFKDADENNRERIYVGCVFNDILTEYEGLGENHPAKKDMETIEQLELLASIVYTDYVQIVCA